MVAIYLLIAALLVVADQLIKVIIDLRLGPLGESLGIAASKEIVVFDNLFSLTHVKNEGAAWGALEGKRWFLVIVATFAVAVIIYMLSTGKIKGVCYKAATIMLLAGGLGNLIDRVFRGYVIDYIRTLFVDFPVYNFADILITVGAGFLIIKLVQELWVEFKADRAKKRVASEQDDEDADEIEACSDDSEIEF